MKYSKYTTKQCIDCRKYQYSWAVRPPLWNSDRCWKHLSGSEKDKWKEELQKCLNYNKSLRLKSDEIKQFNMFLTTNHEVKQLLKDFRIHDYWEVFRNKKFTSYNDFLNFNILLHPYHDKRYHKYSLNERILEIWKSYKKIIYDNDYISLLDSELTGIDFSNCIIEFAIFDNCLLKNCNFKNASFKNILCDNIQFKNTDFSYGIFNKVKLTRSVVNQSIFNNTDFQQIDFSKSTIKKSKFINASFNSTNLSNSNLDSCDFSGSRFNLFQCNNSNFITSSLNEIYCNECEFINSNMSYIAMSNSVLEKSILNGANFQGSVLTGSDLTGSSFIDTNFSFCDLRDVNFQNVELHKTQLRETKVYFEDIKSAKIFHHQLHDNSFKIIRKEKTKVFISYNHNDNEFANKLTKALKANSIDVWIDSHEILPGDSLIQRIREGLDTSKYVCAILSRHSISSPWVQQELDIAMNQQIENRTIKVIPIVLEKKIQLPNFLVGKLYVDFSEPGNFDASVSQILRRINR